MPLAKKHKPYVAVLGVALGALAIDSLVLGEGPSGPTPAQAKASAEAGASAPAAAPAVAVAAAEAAPAGRARLAERLQSLKAGRSADVPAALFCQVAPWLSPPEEAGAQASAPEGEGAAPAEPEPEPVYQLTSVLAAGERSCVILEGKTLRLGDRYGDLRLHAVELGAAVFERNGQFVRVEVQVK